MNYLQKYFNKVKIKISSFDEYETVSKTLERYGVSNGKGTAEVPAPKNPIIGIVIFSDLKYYTIRKNKQAIYEDNINDEITAKKLDNILNQLLYDLDISIRSYHDLLVDEQQKLLKVQQSISIINDLVKQKFEAIDELKDLQQEQYKKELQEYENKKFANEDDKLFKDLIDYIRSGLTCKKACSKLNINYRSLRTQVNKLNMTLGQWKYQLKNNGYADKFPLKKVQK